MDINVLIRLAALLGGFLILAAAITSAFSLRLARRIKKPFTAVHHPLSIAGTALIVIHTLLVAWQLKSPRILLPNFNSWHSFWGLAGCPALILFAIGILAAISIRRIPRFWRSGHWLIYPAMLMAGIHGLRTGKDLRHPLLAIVMGTLLFLSIAVFFYKRVYKSRPSKHAE
jgi:hypothetical protein